MSTDYTSSNHGANPYTVQTSYAGLNSPPPAQAVAPAGEQTGPLSAPIPGYSGLSQSSQVRADFNNDGQDDLLWRNYATGQNVVWFLNGTALTSYAYLAPVGDLNWRIQGTGDFTGDNKTDILWRNSVTGENVVWVMNGTQLTSVTYLAPVGDLNWQVQGIADFTGDNRVDILWRNYSTGQNVVWAMNGTALASVSYLPDVPGVNLRVQAIGDFNRDGRADILWRNYLSGENLVWLMNGLEVMSTGYVMSAPDLNWQIRGASDFNNDGNVDILWRNSASGQNVVWFMNGLAFNGVGSVTAVPDLNWQTGLQNLPIYSPVSITNLSFSGREGDSGQFQVRLNQAPLGTTSLTFSTGNFLVVDADNTIANGTQTSITFTPTDWFVPRTVSFIAEVDGSSQDRLMGNTVSYSLSGGLSGSGTYDLGASMNTYAPDPTQFNIDLDFRNDSIGFWTPARQAIARKAANDWASVIANEWADFQLNNSLNRLETASGRPYSFTSKRFVDDLLIFVNLFQDSGGIESGLGGPDYEFGGWATSPTFYGLMPRVGQIAISPTVFANQPDTVLYQVISHEIGHVLGLVGLNWLGNRQTDQSNPRTAVFRGEYSRQVFGEYIPLRSQDGGDFYHPAARVPSIMSYQYIYRLPGPSQIDFAMLADSGYRVYGINA